jgi:hypothetical protein
MIATVDLSRRFLALGLVIVLGLLAAPPVSVVASSHVDELYGRLELPRGDIEFDLEFGQLQFFDEENAPFALKIIDGCAVNGHYWIFGAGLAGDAAPLTVIDRQSGQSKRLVLPAYEAGAPIASILETEALRLCRDDASGGLPPLSGHGTYTSATLRCSDTTDAIELLSAGRDDAYRTLIRGGLEENRVIRDKPVAAVDASNDYDELHLLTEGRTPRRIEGVVFSGSQGMLPARSKLDKEVKSLSRSRVRRAFETAKNGRIPQGIIDDLGLKGVSCVHHLSLELDTLGADAYLAEAGWIKDGGRPLEPPQPVADRFVVELVQADGTTTPMQLVGPLMGSDREGLLWRYRSKGAQVDLLDACSLSGSFWTVAAADTDEPLQLMITDSVSGGSASLLLWTDRADTSWLADTASLPICS